MSTIRMSPEFIATIQTGAVVRVVEGGAPFGAKVERVWVETAGDVPFDLGVPEGADGAHVFCVEVDDGIEGDRCVVFERLGGFVREHVDALRSIAESPDLRAWETGYAEEIADSIEKLLAPAAPT